MDAVLSKEPKQRFDLYARVTGQIIEAIEAGAGKFEMPWHRSGGPVMRPRNAITGTAYRGVNILALWSQAMVKGYPSALWGTYKQWHELGWQVRKGEKATTVVYFRQMPIEGEDVETGEPTSDYRLIARAFFVFNASQVDGWKDPEVPTENLVSMHEEIEQFIENTGADIRYGGEMACYRPLDDYIQLPDRARFRGSSTSSATESFYATSFHELVHWTGSRRRLNRKLSGRFGSDDYAMEELVAELGAAYLSAEFLVPNTPRPDHAAYLEHWLRVLRSDKRAIFAASNMANEAVSWLMTI